MKKNILLINLCCIFSLMFFSCGNKQSDIIVSRTFQDDTWERFDVVSQNLEVKKPTIYNIGMNLTLTEVYPYDNFEMNFLILSPDGDPYRTKNYKYKLKDENNKWKSIEKEGTYSFELPINEELMIDEPGDYTIQIEYRKPITPIQGVRKIEVFYQVGK